MRDRLKTILKYAGIFVFWIGVWYLASKAVGSELLLPSPFRTFKSLLALLGTWDFYRATLSRCV